MNVISAIVTSKGQVTLPKTIRDLLRLNTGDKVDFFINEDHQVIMKKNKMDAATEALFNLIMLFIEKNKYPIAINGNIGSGKTTFVANLIVKKFAGQKVGILEPHNELYNILKDSLDKDDLNKIVLIPNKISVDEIVKHQLDLLVIDEMKEAQLNLIKTIKKQNIRFIGIKHFFNIEEMSQIGNHISVSMGSLERGKVDKIENIQFKNDECIRTPIYIS